MKRPLGVCMVGLVLGEAAAYQIQQRGFLIPASLFMISIAIAAYHKKKKPFFIACILIGLCFLFGYRCMESEIQKEKNIRSFVLKLVEQDKDRTMDEIRIQGKIDQIKPSSSGKILIIKEITCYKNSHTYKISARCNLYTEEKEDFVPGDVIDVKGSINIVEAPTNPGEFDRQISAWSNGIYLQCYADHISFVRRSKGIVKVMAEQCRNIIEEGFQTLFEEKEAALLDAMVLGNKSNLSIAQKKLYEQNGVAHLLAVSGLHISIFGGRIFRIMRKKGVRYIYACVGGFSILLFYAFMTSMGSSVKRAVSMYLIFLLAQYFGSAYDLLSSMSVSAIWLLIEYPFRLLEGGFLISFLSVFAIGSICPLIKECIAKKELKKTQNTKKRSYSKRFVFIKEALLMSAVVSFVTMPVGMRFFYEYAPGSILLNLIVLPCMPILLSSALITAFFFVLGTLLLRGQLCMVMASYLKYQMAWLAHFPAKIILNGFDVLLKLMQKVPGAYLVTGCPKVWEIAVIYLVEAGMVAVWYFFGKRKMIAFGVSLGMMFFLLKSQQNGIRITMLDVGQGESIIFQMPFGKTVMIDGGSLSKKKVGQYILEPALKYYGVTALDYVIITHMDEDHYNGIAELAENGYPIRNLLLTKKDFGIEKEENLLRDFRKYGIRQYYAQKGTVLRFEEAKMTCLYPEKVDLQEVSNAFSQVYLLEYHDFRMLLTGDIGMEQEREVLRAYQSLQRKKQSITLLKVPHHGSKYSSSEEFIQQLSPKIAILSAGQHYRFGHPHKELLERLEKENVRIYRTDQKGAIVMKVLKDDFKIRYYRDDQ